MLSTHPLIYADGDTPLHGHYAFDDAATDRRPGVLVVHEFAGLSEHARSRADRLAAELGYAALAVDIYGHGKLASGPQEAKRLMDPFVDDPGLLRRRIRAGLTALRQQPHVDATRIGAIGFCFGGRTAIELARDGADVLAVVSFHGALDTKRPAAKGAVTAKVLSCTGSADPMIGPDRVRAFQDEMTAAGADWQTTVYGGAEHAFTNPNAGRNGAPGMKYDANADRRSWAAMRELFDEVFNVA
jgi:dienelactone hydrolase